MRHRRLPDRPGSRSSEPHNRSRRNLRLLIGAILLSLIAAVLWFAPRGRITAQSAALIRINTGGPAQTVDGVTWSGCTSFNDCNGYVSGGFAYTEQSFPAISGVSAPSNEAVYQTEWTGGCCGPNPVPVGSVAFSYNIPVSNGAYLIRLHFAELNKNGPGLRVFDVNIEGGPNELAGFDVFAEAGGIYRALVREFPVTINDGAVTIDFVRQVENAKISAIEVLPVEAAPEPPTPEPPSSTPLPATLVPGELPTPTTAADTLTPTATIVPTTTVVPPPSQSDNVLIFSKTAAFRHDSIPDGIAAIRELGLQNGFTVDQTEDAAAFTDANLSQYKAVIFLSTTGDVLNSTQQAAFERYIRAGNGFVGIHAASDTEYSWPWYGELVGAYFKDHPAVQPATISVEDQTHPSTAHLPSTWQRTDEWYNFQSNPRAQVQVLATLNEASYSGGSMGDHPIAWYHAYDGGRAWYTGGGHTQASYTEPEFRQHLLGGIQYAAGSVAAPTATPAPPNQTVTPLAPTATPTPSPAPLTPTAALDTTVIARINAGGPALTTGGVSYSADQYFSGGYTYNNPKVTSIANTTDDALYLTERSATSDLGSYSYRIPVPSSGSYRVRLHFAEIHWTKPGQRVFSVNLEGGPVELNNYDIIKDVGAQTAVIKEYTVNVADGALDLAFTATVNRPKISAIEVLRLGTGPATPTATSAAATPTATATPEGGSGWTPLFNGQNLDGWYTWLPSTGKNNDPRRVFQVQDGMIRMLNIPTSTRDQEFGYIATNQEYANYRLRFQYKWGDKRFPPRANAKRDSGLLYHMVGRDMIWPRSIEHQVQEGDTGDFYMLGNTGLSTTVESTSAGAKQYKEGGAPYAQTSGRIIKSGTYDSLTDWNTVEVIVSGDEAVHIVNGAVNNRGTDFRQPDPTNANAQIPLTKGKILFQAEGAEVFYRNIEIQPLDYAPAPSGATVLFNNSGTSQWQPRTGGSVWPVVDGALQACSGCGDIRTKQTFNDFRLHLEFKVPSTPTSAGEQDRGNSGLYLQQRYEIQVLDSWKRALSGADDLGAIYGVRDASSNAGFPSETWQSYDITFRAARWANGVKTENARITVRLNGVVIQNNIEIPGSTAGGDAEAPSAGPLTLQEHGNAVQYRNIWIEPLN